MWERPLPRISDQFLNSVVYLYPSEAEAEDGKPMGGTGFLVGLPLEGFGDETMAAVVTNKHVILDGNTVVRINKVSGDTDIRHLDDRSWIYHPDGDDLAVCPIELNDDIHQVTVITPDLLLTEKTIQDEDIGPGEDVFVVGRFINHEGKKQNLPSVRFGNIAQMPIEPIVQEDGHEQDSFLVEARSLGGYSGAPVFVMIAGQIGKTRRKFLNIVPSGPWLLGVNYSYLRSKKKIFSDETPKTRPVNEHWFVDSNTGMMGVVPAWKLAKLLEEPAIMEAKRQAESRMAKVQRDRDSPVVLTGAQTVSAPSTNPDNPSHKEDFTRLLHEATKAPRSNDQT